MTARIHILLAVLVLASAAPAQPTMESGAPLAPADRSNPLAMLETFEKAMEAYQKGLARGDDRLQARIADAARCFDLSEVPESARPETGRESAIFMKEIVDRIGPFRLKSVPQPDARPDAPVRRWQVEKTEIFIELQTDGEQVGQYLFSPNTVRRLPNFYEKVKHLPYREGHAGAGYREPWVQRNLPAWAHREVIGLEVWQWAGLFLAILLGLTMRAVARAAGRLLQKLTHRTRTEWDDRIIEALSAPVGLLAAAGIWYVAVHLLRFREIALEVLSVVVQIVVSGALIWLFYRLAIVAGEYLQDRSRRTTGRLDDQLVKLLANTMKTFVVVMGVLLAAQNLGVEVFSILAGLGIGGLAVALAAKDTLANFFGSITIMLDKPFRVGDWVIVGEHEGTVEEIGFRTTRIRTFYNSVISIPNSIISTAGVDNMGLRQFRRVKRTLAITYDTPPEKIEAFLEGIKNIIKANPHTRKDYFHVVLRDFGASSFDILLYCFVKVPDWSTELIESQNIFLEIIRLAHQLGVQFAFPTRTLHVDTFPEKAPANPGHDVDADAFAATARNFGPGGTQSKPGGSGLFTPPHMETPDQP